MTAETFADAYPARFATATMPARRRSRCVLFRLFCTIMFTAWSPPARLGRRTVSELTARRPRRTGHQALLGGLDPTRRCSHSDPPQRDKLRCRCLSLNVLLSWSLYRAQVPKAGSQCLCVQDRRYLTTSRAVG